MSNSRNGRLAAACGVAIFFSLAPACATEPGHFGYGKAPTQKQIDGWNIDVRGDDGAGLPPGKGDVDRGANIFVEQCSACHGVFGEAEGRYPKLMGGGGTFTSDRPEPSVGSYWPYAPTLFDYINRAMPFQSPHTLPTDDVYALTAYVLNFNNLVPNDFVADKDSLPNVKMPNRDHFMWEDPRPDTPEAACMKSCKDPAKLKVETTAEGQSLTPKTDGPLDEMQPK